MESELDLLRRARVGDQAASEVLFRSHIHESLREPFLILGDRQLAEYSAKKALGEPAQASLDRYRAAANAAKATSWSSEPQAGDLSFASVSCIQSMLRVFPSRPRRAPQISSQSAATDTNALDVIVAHGSATTASPGTI